MIRLPRFLIALLTVTACSLVYVWQQTEVFRLAYDGQKQTARFQDLLDDNSILRYNLKKTTSLVALGNRVSGSSDFQMPANYCFVKVARAPQSNKIVRAERETLVSRIFGIKRQAEAKTINPSMQLGGSTD